LTGILPIRTVEFDFLVRFFPFIFLQILTFELAARGRGYLWLGQRYTMVRFPIYTRAIATFFVNRPLPFVVTPKGADRTPVRTYKWQLLMVVATPLALIWATVAYARGWVDYGAAGWRSGAFVLNGIWMLWTAAYALRVVKMAREMRQHDEYRFRDELPIRIFGVGRTGVEGAPALGLTKEVSTSYLSFLSVAPISPSERVQVVLPLITGEREITTEVLTRREVKRGEAVFWEHRCRNEDVDLETQFAIEQHCLHHAVPGRRKRYSSRPDLFEDLRRFLREQRRTARNAVRLPAQVRLYAEGKPGRWRSAVIEELDTNGAQLMLDADPPIGSRIDFQVPGVELNGCGRVVHVAAVETPLARRWIVGLRHGEIHVENPDAVPLAPLPEPALEVVATIATELEQPALPVTVDGLPPGSPLPIEPEVGAGDEPEGMARLVS
jgi:hypothetical protein